MARERGKPMACLAGTMPLVQGQARTRRFFDWLAPRYDVVNAVIFRPEWRRMVREAILPGRVLDVGVGTGYSTRGFRDAVGLDISSGMLARAEYDGSLVRADAMRAPFRAAAFSTIVCAGSFYYLPDPMEALRGFWRVLEAHGRVVLLSPEAWFLRPLVRIYTKSEYQKMAGATGFVLERHETLRGVACLVLFRKE